MKSRPFLYSHPLLRAGLFAACASALAAVARAQNASPVFYGIGKGLNYVQTSSAAPAFHPQQGRFETVGDLPGSLRLPSGNTQNYTASGIDQRFATQAAMDAAFPAGA